jgi:hypothetical protein
MISLLVCSHSHCWSPASARTPQPGLSPPKSLKGWRGLSRGADRYEYTELRKHRLCSRVARCSDRLEYTIASEAALYPFRQHTWVTRAYELPPIAAYSQCDRQHYGRIALALPSAVRRVGTASIALTAVLYFCSSTMFSRCYVLPPKPKTVT